MGRLGRAACTVHLIFPQTNQEENECTTTKERQRAYCLNLYTVGHTAPLPPPHLEQPSFHFDVVAAARNGQVNKNGKTSNICLLDLGKPNI